MNKVNSAPEELSNTPTYAENSNSNKQNSHLIERKEIPGTPFIIIKQDKQHFLTFGEYRLTEGFKTEKALLTHIDKNNWVITLKLIATCIEINEKLQKDKNITK